MPVRAVTPRSDLALRADASRRHSPNCHMAEALCFGAPAQKYRYVSLRIYEFVCFV
jgi:hypothetical protein